MSSPTFFNGTAALAVVLALFFVYEISRKPIYKNQRLTRSAIFLMMESVFGLWIAAARFSAAEEYVKTLFCVILSMAAAVAVLIAAIMDLRKITSAYVFGARSISDDLRNRR